MNVKSADELPITNVSSDLRRYLKRLSNNLMANGVSTLDTEVFTNILLLLL